MKRLISHFGILLTICLIAGLTASSNAEIENLKFELFGVVNSDDERQIRRRLGTVGGTRWRDLPYAY